VDQVTLTAFQDELAKTAGLGDLWDKVLNLFPLGRLAKKKKDPKTKADLLAEYHFSPKAGDDRWDKFAKNVRDPKYLASLTKHPMADEKLVQHAKAMHDMARGATVGKVQSSRLPGRSYEIKEIPSGLACTCPDWRFKGSVTPGYECKHIRAHTAGKARA